MRKLKFIILSLVLVFIAVFGRKYYVETYAGLKEYKSLKAKNLQSEQDIAVVNSSLSQNEGSLIANNYAVTYDNLSNFVNSLSSLEGVTIQSMSAKKIKNDTVLDIAEVSDVSVLSNYSDTVDCIEINCSVTEVSSVRSWFAQNQLKFVSISIYPVNNEIDFYFLIIGGASK